SEGLPGELEVARVQRVSVGPAQFLAEAQGVDAAVFGDAAVLGSRDLTQELRFECAVAAHADEARVETADDPACGALGGETEIEGVRLFRDGDDERAAGLRRRRSWVSSGERIDRRRCLWRSGGGATTDRAPRQDQRETEQRENNPRPAAGSDHAVLLASGRHRSARAGMGAQEPMRRGMTSGL